MTIEQKVISAIIYTLLISVISFLFGKRNGTKVDDIVTTVKTDASTLETRVRALEDATQHLLTTHLEEAKAETATATSAIKQAIASVQVKPETIVSAIESEIKKAL